MQVGRYAFTRVDRAAALLLPADARGVVLVRDRITKRVHLSATALLRTSVISMFSGYKIPTVFSKRYGDSVGQFIEVYYLLEPEDVYDPIHLKRLVKDELDRVGEGSLLGDPRPKGSPPEPAVWDVTNQFVRSGRNNQIACEVVLGEQSQTATARKYGITRTRVNHIVNRFQQVLTYDLYRELGIMS